MISIILPILQLKLRFARLKGPRLHSYYTLQNQGLNPGLSYTAKPMFKRAASSVPDTQQVDHYFFPFIPPFYKL